MSLKVQLLELSGPSVAYAVLGGFAVLFSMVNLLVKERLYVGEVVLATAFGVAIGPYGGDIFNPRGWTIDSDPITLEVMRVVLAVGLFAIGVELPKSYMAKHSKSLAIMVIPTMAFGWLMCAGFIILLFPKLHFISALVVSACLTPTDPILASAIINGKFAEKNVPKHVRQLLAAESAANDGLAYPFLTLAVYLTLERTSGVAVEKWFLVGCLYQVVLGTIMGAIIGLLFCKLMEYTEKRGFINHESYLAQYLVLALFTIGIASLLGCDDLLAAFACGSAVSWDGHFNEKTEEESFAAILDLVFNIACFVYIGAWLPFSSFSSPELGISVSRLLGFFVIILVLRRVPCILALYKWVPDIQNWREALFCGYFGPMGVGAVFISTLAIEKLPKAHEPPEQQVDYLVLSLRSIVSFVVLGSILIHGLSIPFFSFGRQLQTVTRSMTIGNDAPEWLAGMRRSPGIYSESGNDGINMSRMTTGSALASSPSPPEDAERGEHQSHVMRTDMKDAGKQ